MKRDDYYRLFKEMTAEDHFHKRAVSRHYFSETAVQDATVERDSIPKRVFDIFLAVVGLIFSAWIWVLIWIAIVLEDGLPVIIRQERIGKNGRLFKSYKFRSMKKYTLQEKISLQAQENDPRVTCVGRILRKCALDELPQLLNILFGDMSFVGPRALLPMEKEVHDCTNGGVCDIRQIPGYKERIKVKPGLTGVAQIWAPRDIPRRHKFKYDLFYIKKQSFFFDIKLILLSFLITFTGTWERRGLKLGLLTRSNALSLSFFRQSVVPAFPLILFLIGFFPSLAALNNFARQWTTFTAIVSFVRFFAPETDLITIGMLINVGRDSIHLILYGTLTLLTFYTYRAGRKRLSLDDFIYPGIFVVLFAIADEVIQHFIPNRGSSVLDCLVDGLSAVLVLLILYRHYKSKVVGDSSLLRRINGIFSNSRVREFIRAWSPVGIFLIFLFLTANVFLTNKNTLAFIKYVVNLVAPQANLGRVCMYVGKCRDYSHIIIYAFLTCLVFRGFNGQAKKRCLRYGIYAGIFVLFLGIVDEMTQGLFRGRSSSLTDWLIDVVGVVVGFVLIWFRNSLRVNKAVEQKN